MNNRVVMTLSDFEGHFCCFSHTWRNTALLSDNYVVLTRESKSAVASNYGRPMSDHYIFSPVISTFLSFFFFSFLAYLTSRRFDVYHTSTHGVALVRI